jgi:hypothetical protein
MIVKDLLGVTALKSGKAPSATLNTDFSGPMDSIVWNAYQDTANLIASEVIAGPNKSKFISCDPATTATCYSDTIKAFGRKAFRHPLSQAEVDRFMKLTTIVPAGTVAEISEALLYAFLVSPSFIQVNELSVEKEGPAYKLSSHEMATRLSLMIWGSIPDDALSAAADKGELATKEQVLAQASRMIAVKDKVAPQIAAAHRAYLVMDDASHWWKVSHDATKYSGYSDASKTALGAELDSFFADIVSSGGSFKDFFTSNVGYVNKDTAALYGLDAKSYGADLKKVELKDRPGFLTRAGFLSSFAGAESTSPILRGAFITVNLLGVDPGPKKDGVSATPPAGTYTTERAAIEKLTEPSDCAGCHKAFINPPGFTLEGFDAAGRVQTTDPRGGMVNTVADVNFGQTVGVRTIKSPTELMQGIADAAEARTIYVRRVLSFETGRTKNTTDECLVKQLDMKMGTAGYTFLNLLTDLSQADSSRLRIVGN